MAADFPELKAKFRGSETRVFNCMLRFLRLPELLDQDDVLVCDIDSIVNQPIVMPPCDMALFFRPWLRDMDENLQVLLTASYWARSAKPFAEKIREELLSRVINWMDDQTIVWRLYNEIGDQYRIRNLTEDFVNYHFDRDAPIWTCKGPTRKNNPTYLARKNLHAA